MIKRTITYTDYNGTERTEDFYFNFSNAEIAEMELSHPGGLKGHLERIVQAKEQSEIVRMFKELILMAYGIKSPDGRRFMKSDEIREGFAQTEAYSILFMELATDEQAAVAFTEGIIPDNNE